MSACLGLLNFFANTLWPTLRGKPRKKSGDKD